MSGHGKKDGVIVKQGLDMEKKEKCRKCDCVCHCNQEEHYTPLMDLCPCDKCEHEILSDEGDCLSCQ